MHDNRTYILWFDDIRLTDIPTVGGKNASLGQMIADLTSEGIKIPPGFAITAQAYRYYVQHNTLDTLITQQMALLHDSQDTATVKKIGSTIRAAFEQGTIPDDLAQEIAKAYEQLSERNHQQNVAVAIRSSATAEDLPTASFAGQQESFLNVQGVSSVLEHCKKCFSSLFTDRAIVYRAEHNFDVASIALSIGIQKMVRSDKASSGVAFSLDPETGFKDIVVINGSYGLGELVVQGEVTPDEFMVHKPTLAQHFSAIISKKLGNKKIKMIYDEHGKRLVKTVPVSVADQNKFCLSDDDIIALAQQVVAIEQRYTELKGSWSPMDIEWAKDGDDGVIYIVQARPETVHGSKKNGSHSVMYQLDASIKPTVIGTGQSIGQGIAQGNARILKTIADSEQLKQGDVLVTDMTDPSWVPIMKKCSGIITNKGGRTCHAAIVSRELGIPAIVGVTHATTLIKNGQEVTLDCSQGSLGYIYDGNIPFKKVPIEQTDMPNLNAKIMINIADPERAFSLAQLPVDGVGLMRIEFIISNSIRVHPMALLYPERIKNKEVVEEINHITAMYPTKKDFFIDALTYGIATIAAAFYPKKVVVRFSDFKSNEYRDLLGGSYFEQNEENPMLGFRGASRYYHERYQEAFALECAAIKKVREQVGLTNCALLVPFVRTIAEAEKVINLLQQNGLKSGKNGLEIMMMVEIPSNVILIEQFSHFFDGFSIGSNDLTQLTLGVDRDSQILAPLFDERDPAVVEMLKAAIAGAHKQKRPIGICGQAPSDYPEIADLLLQQKIDSMSLNPDAVLPFLRSHAQKS